MKTSELIHTMIKKTHSELYTYDNMKKLTHHTSSMITPGRTSNTTRDDDTMKTTF